MLGYMKTTRQQILDYIFAQRVATVIELSQALHMTKQNVRHHLAILQKQGRVEVVGERRPRGKGRPAKLFAPSKRSLGNSLDLLSSALLERLLSDSQPGEKDYEKNQEARTELLRNLAASLVNQITGADEPETQIQNVKSSLTGRLYETIQTLNRANYQARWEARSDAPRLILGYCPYGIIIDKHPELCEMDRFLLESLLETPVKQTGKLIRDSRGAPFCIFRIR